MAPEIVDGSEGYDCVVDSWSIGVIVWVMCDASPPICCHCSSPNDRLTMCTPFIEDSEIINDGRRLLHRRIEWSILETYHVSDLGKVTLFDLSSSSTYRHS